MNTEQERIKFEAACHRHAEEAGHEGAAKLERDGDGYADPATQAAWWGWREGRAALQSQDREDEVEFQIGIEGEVQAQTFGPREQAWAEIQRYAAQYAEDGPIEIWEVTRRRIEGEGK